MHYTYYISSGERTRSNAHHATVHLQASSVHQSHSPRDTSVCECAMHVPKFYSRDISIKSNDKCTQNNSQFRARRLIRRQHSIRSSRQWLVQRAYLPSGGRIECVFVCFLIGRQTQHAIGFRLSPLHGPHTAAVVGGGGGGDGNSIFDSSTNVMKMYGFLMWLQMT